MAALLKSIPALRICWKAKSAVGCHNGTSLRSLWFGSSRWRWRIDSSHGCGSQIQPLCRSVGQAHISPPCLFVVYSILFS